MYTIRHYNYDNAFCYRYTDIDCPGISATWSGKRAIPAVDRSPWELSQLWQIAKITTTKFSRAFAPESGKRHRLVTNVNIDDADADENEFWQAAAGRQSLSTLLSEQIVRRWREKEQKGNSLDTRSRSKSVTDDESTEKVVGVAVDCKLCAQKDQKIYFWESCYVESEANSLKSKVLELQEQVIKARVHK